MAIPTVTGIDIGSGPAGTQVIVSGSNFDDTITNIAFGVYSAGSNYVVLSETEIAVFIPAGAGTDQTVYVTNADGTGSLVSLWTWDTYEGGDGGGGGGVPVVSDLVPDTSTSEDGSGGDSVTITGTGFITARFVYFGETQADFTIVNDTEITVIAPPGSGVVEVDVENIYGRSADPGSANNFTYPTFDAPTITAVISPAAGIAGTRVEITGTSFTTANEVLFGTYGAVFNIISDTVIECWAPYGPTGTVNVLVRNPAGQSPEPTTPAWNDFTYAGAPTGLTVTPLANAVEIKWDAVSDSLHATYRVYGDANATPLALIATTAQTSIIYAVGHSLSYYYAVSYVDEYGNETAKSAAVGPISSLETIADVIADGAIDAMSMFAAGITPPQVLLAADYPTALPVLPDTDFPNGSTVFWEVDRRLYRNLGGGPHLNTDTDKATWYDRKGTYDFNLGANFDFDDDSGWVGTGLGADAYALHFNGLNDWATCSAMPNFAADHSFTIEAWVRRDVLQTGYLICLTDNTPTTLRNYLALGVQYSSGFDRGVYAAYKDDTGTACTCYDTSASTYASYDGLWHHICLTVDGATATTYLDGIQTRQKTDWTTGTFTPENFTIGRIEAASPGSYFAGDVAAIRCYSGTLTAAQVRANVGQGPTGQAYLQTDLVIDLSAKYATENDSWLPVVDVGEAGGLMTADNLAANCILAGMLSVGSVGADEIAANSIASKHIFIGNFDNLVTNPQSEMTSTGRDTSLTSPEYEFRGVTSTNPYSGTYCRRLIGVASGDTTMAVTRPIPVLPGEKYYCECRARLGSAVGHGHLRLVCYKSDGSTQVSTSPAETDAITVNAYPTDPIEIKNGSADPWYEIPDGSGTPADAGAYIQVYLVTTDIGAANYLYVDCMFLRRMNEGSLIVDGAIDGKVIQGPTIRTYVETDPENPTHKRVELRQGTAYGDADKVLWYPYDNCNDASAACIQTGGSSTDAWLKFMGPLVGNEQGYITMEAIDGGAGPDVSYLQVDATQLLIGRGCPGDNPYEDESNVIALGGPVSIGPSRYAGIANQHEFLRPAGQYTSTGGTAVYVDDWSLNRLSLNGYNVLGVTTDGVHHPGVLQLGCSAYSGSGCFMRTGYNAIDILDSGTGRSDAYDYDYCEFTFRIPTGGAANTHARMGFMNGPNLWSSADPTTGDYGAYINILGTSVQGVVCVNGTAYTATAGSISENVWYTAKVLIKDGTDTYFWIYAPLTRAKQYSPTGEPRDPSGTPIEHAPTGDQLGHGFICWTTSSTEKGIFDIDYMNYYLAPRDR